MAELFDELQGQCDELEFEKILQEKFDSYNREFFDGKIAKQDKLLEQPKVWTWSASYNFESHRIKIHPELITGSHYSINPEAPIKGIELYIFDSLLHEMIHKYCVEVLDVKENDGHGPEFEKKCYEIAETLMLEIIDEKDIECFPLNSRPKYYYMGAWRTQIARMVGSRSWASLTFPDKTYPKQLGS